MFIKCPKCQTIYQIGDDVITKDGLKMHCQKCDAVFKAFPGDAVKSPQEQEQEKQNVAKMFEQVIPSASELFGPQNTPPVRVMHVTKYKNTINYLLILALLLLVGVLVYALRYDVVRYAPRMEKFYQKFGVESVYDGTALEFSNLKISEVSFNSLSKLKISGIIKNPSGYTVNVPPIRIVVYDANQHQLLNTTHYLAAKRMGAYYQLGFEFLLTNPTPQQKTIQITFANNE